MNNTDVYYDVPIYRSLSQKINDDKIKDKIHEIKEFSVIDAYKDEPFISKQNNSYKNILILLFIIMIIFFIKIMVPYFLKL